MTGAVDESMVDALWLDTLHRIVGRAAHELKGALNGVSVNLEVVRSRAEKPDAPASNVSKFAIAAAGQLDAVIAMSDALLSLARAARAPVDLGLLVARVGALLAPAARAEGRRLVLDPSLGELGVTSAAGNAARVAVGGSLLAAIEQSAEVRCAVHVGGTGAGPAMRIECSDGVVPVVGPEIVAAAADAGIQIVAESSAVFISFPR